MDNISAQIQHVDEEDEDVAGSGRKSDEWVQ